MSQQCLKLLLITDVMNQIFVPRSCDVWVTTQTRISEKLIFIFAKPHYQALKGLILRRDCYRFIEASVLERLFLLLVF